MRLNNFVIVGTQRTGSSAIVEALGTHPEICCGREWTQETFPPLKIKIASQALQGNFMHLDLPNRTHMQSVFSEDIRWIGFKRLFRSSDKWLLHPKHSPVLWLDTFSTHMRWFVDQPSLHIIHIVRHDNLAWLRSKSISKKTTLYFGEKYPENIRVLINTREAVKRLKTKKWIDRQLASLARKNPYIQVSYEDFAINNRSVIKKIVAFLDCDPGKLPESIIMAIIQSVVSVEQNIINYNELVAVLREQNLV